MSASLSVLCTAECGALLDYFSQLGKSAPGKFTRNRQPARPLEQVEFTDLIPREYDMIIAMTPTTKKLLEQVETWPPEDQDELAEYAREIAARRTGVYHATPEELQAIDEALGQVARGELTSKEEVEAAFAAFRGA
jgi:hypothetical protein